MSVPIKSGVSSISKTAETDEIAEINPKEFCGVYSFSSRDPAYKIMILKPEPPIRRNGQPCLRLEYIPLNGSTLTRDCILERLSVEFGDGGRIWARGRLQDVKIDPKPPHNNLPQAAPTNTIHGEPTYEVVFMKENGGPWNIEWASIEKEDSLKEKLARED
ncbi:hypothetical protein CaCOL14_009992 [Colletotrichum acutatum]